MLLTRKLTMLAAATVTVMAAAQPAMASHFRGNALVPTVSATGLLTVTQTAFWRKGTSSATTVKIGTTNMTKIADTTITSDSRYDVRKSTWTSQLAVGVAGTFDVSSTSCCRVKPGGVGNWNESTWTMNSSIVWDGATAANPIDFNFALIQPEVNRGAAYNQNLFATSPDGLTLTYDQALNQNITAQPPGLTINATTGLMNIPSGAGGTAGYLDNTTPCGSGCSTVGADAAFSGNIFAKDASGNLLGQVEFDWMFDGVDVGGGGNAAPIVDDAIINALVGDNISHIFTGSDPDSDPLTWGATVTLGGLFNDAGFSGALPTWNPGTQQITWDSTGVDAGRGNPRRS